MTIHDGMGLGLAFLLLLGFNRWLFGALARRTFITEKAFWEAYQRVKNAGRGASPERSRLDRVAIILGLVVGSQVVCFRFLLERYR